MSQKGFKIKGDIWNGQSLSFTVMLSGKSSAKDIMLASTLQSIIFHDDSALGSI